MTESQQGHIGTDERVLSLFCAMVSSTKALTSYVTLLGILLLLAMASTALFAETEMEKAESGTTSAQSIEYPPYPDVWGYEFPSPAPHKRSGITVHEVNGGDYAITYMIDPDSRDRKWERKGVYFFSREAIAAQDVKEYAHRAMFGERSGVGHIDIRDEISWHQIPTDLGSCLGYSKFVITKYAPRRTNEHLSIVYFSDEPIRRRYLDAAYDQCIKGAGQRFRGESYYQQVFDVLPVFVPLKDGTFLCYNALGNFIIRLDKDFNSKSDLLNRKVFVVRMMDLRAIERELFKADVFNRQTYDLAVRAYIKALRQGVPGEEALKGAMDRIKQITEEYYHGN